MTWTPERNATDVSTLVPNLLQFFEDHGADALAWANGTPLTTWKQMYNSVAGRVHTNFPDLMVTGEAYRSSYEGDEIGVNFVLEIEQRITDSSADALTLKVKPYVRAVESMIINIPSAALTAGMEGAGTASVVSVETDYQRLLQGANSFLQTPVTRAVIQFTENYYAD